MAALQRGVQGLATDPESPLPFCAAGDTVVKVEPAESGSGIPRRTIRRCRMGVASLKRNEPETADGPGGPCRRCAARAGLRRLWRPSSNVHPPPPDFGPLRPAGRDYLPEALGPGLLIIPWAVQAQSDPTELTSPIVADLTALERGTSPPGTPRRFPALRGWARRPRRASRSFPTPTRCATPPSLAFVSRMTGPPARASRTLRAQPARARTKTTARPSMRGSPSPTAGTARRPLPAARLRIPWGRAKDRRTRR